MPRISPAKNMPSPSRKKLACRPSAGTQSQAATRTSPRNTAGACASSSTRARSGKTKAVVAQALRPARIISAGKSAPMKGSSTIRARLIGGLLGRGRWERRRESRVAGATHTPHEDEFRAEYIGDATPAKSGLISLGEIGSHGYHSPDLLAGPGKLPILPRTSVQPKKTESAPSAEGKTSIQVIERMMKLLDVLAEHADPVQLKQLAIETGLHPSTAHRILGAMTHSGFVERSEAGAYRLGIRLLELGSLVKSRISLRETADALHAQAARRHRREREPGRARRRRDRVCRAHLERGAPRCAWCTSWARARRCTPPPPASSSWSRTASSASATTPAAPPCPPPPRPRSPRCRRWRRNSTACAATAWPSTSTRSRAGVRCIAAGIRDDSGELIAGLSLSTPSERFNPDWAPLVRETADEISRALGHLPPKAG
jgi:DNA-binding IclR family transcriptional regulator